MKRYNIETSEGDLIQFDLAGDSWNVETDAETAHLTIYKYRESGNEQISIPVNKKDLEQLRAYINNMLPK